MRTFQSGTRLRWRPCLAVRPTSTSLASCSIACSMSSWFLTILGFLWFFFFVFFCSVFYESGFKRTLCGGQWQSLDYESDLISTGRLGCCPAGSFMSDPMLNPFSEANSCQQCPPGSFGSASLNDDTQCTIGESPAPAPTNASESKSIHTAIIGIMIAFIIVIFSNAW